MICAENDHLCYATQGSNQVEETDMPTLMSALENYDDGMYPVLAQIWGADLSNLKVPAMRQALQAAMLDREQAEQVWDGLDDNARQALQMLLSTGGEMPVTNFERLFGQVRKLGRNQIEREQPHKNPASVAEALYYRGFVADTFVKTKKGMKPYFFVPEDLATILPTHKTGYDNLEDEPDDFDFPPEALEPGAISVQPLEAPPAEEIQQADTSIVDDLTTFLAYLRMFGAQVVGNSISDEDGRSLVPFLLSPDALRLDFMLGVGVSAGLIEIGEGRARVNRDGLQRWLGQNRSVQIRMLVEAWRESTLYRDLWHLPGLVPEMEAGSPYDPQMGREALVQFLSELVPIEHWWSIEDFLETVKAVEPDFQRPSGDFDGWYIRDAQGTYLRGIESWDAVDGALLDFYLRGPLHWLGLVDVAEERVHLNAYGRALLELIPWPQRREDPEPIQVQPDGVLIATRRSSRLDRFQVARFTTWGAGAAPYYYKLDPEGIQRAASQGITTQHIGAFLQGQLKGAPLPSVIKRLLDTWESGASAQVSVERLLVLRTPSPDTLQRLYDDPAIRRYLGAQLGPTACVIQEGAQTDLAKALGEKGITIG